MIFKQLSNNSNFISRLNTSYFGDIKYFILRRHLFEMFVSVKRFYTFILMLDNILRIHLTLMWKTPDYFTKRGCVSL